MKHQTIIFLIFLVVLNGCRSEQPSIIPAQSIIPTQTSTPRWKIYEKALSKAVVNTNDGLCEWEILGNSGNEVYVWALCKVKEPIGTAGSVPAVIRLAQTGEIEKVDIPKDGNFYSQDIQALFPVEIQEKVFLSTFDGPAAEKHIDKRLKSNEPPMIEISGIPLP